MSIIEPRLILFAKVIVTAIILGIVLSNVEFSALVNVLSQIKLPFLIIAMAMEVPLLLTGVQRWRSVAATFGERLGLRSAVTYELIALFINLGVPSTLGLDAVRAWKLHREVKSLALATRIVITDRLCSLASLLMIVGLGLPKFATLSDAASFSNVVIILTLSSMVGLGLILLFQHLAKVTPTSSVLTYLCQLSHDLSHAFFGDKYAATKIFLWSAGNHLLRIAVIFCLMASLGVNMSLMETFALVPVTFLIAILIAMIPITVGGWGVREAAFIMIFGLAGIAPANALAVSVIYGLITFATALTGGATWMAEKRIIS